MITQKATGLNSRNEANLYNKDGFLPLITAPMYSVVDESNWHIFENLGVQVCMPRNKVAASLHAFHSLSLQEFINVYIDKKYEELGKVFENGIEIKNNIISKICIDTANGNMPYLHDAIRKAKEIHGDKLIIMAGNVASVEAFISLAKTGVDYIRVGIGGGGGCNTTSNTGVGQEDLGNLIEQCFNYRRKESSVIKGCFQEGLSQYLTRHGVHADYHREVYATSCNVSKVKIVADGISSYIKQCEVKYEFNDNGYAAINKLLFAGADLVMVGKLFAQCLESAGDKTSKIRHNSGENWIASGKAIFEIWNNERDELMVKYSGMSTQEEQEKYKKWNPKTNDIIEIKVFSNWSKGRYLGLDNDKKSHLVQDDYGYILKSEEIRPIIDIIKPSEGSVNWIPVRWTLNEWLHGSENQDSYPYLMGWTNSIKSAMAYTRKLTLSRT